MQCKGTLSLFLSALTGAYLAHVGGVGPEVVHRVLARQLHQGLAVAALPEPADLEHKARRVDQEGKYGRRDRKAKGQGLLGVRN